MYKSTVYCFKTSEFYEVKRGAEFAMPYQQFVNVAFTLDPTGGNLPPTIPRGFVKEIQPGQKYNVPIENRDAIARGLDEKGWYLTRIGLGASAWSKADEFKEETLTSAAKEMLVELLQEPKRP